MPRMDQAPPTNQLVKLLLMGDGKIGKTAYAALAAAAGFDVLYLDGDVGAQTIQSMRTPWKGSDKPPLTPEQMSRIYLLPVADTILGGSRDCKFVEVMQEFTTNVKFRWNDTQNRIARIADKTDELWEITPGKMNHNCVLVADSWTGLTESIMLQCAGRNGIDLATASTQEMRPVYQSAGLIATSMLQVIRAMPCHVIVIGHPDEYQHKVAPEGKKVKDISEKDYIIDWTRMVPKSTSRPHGLQMAKYFTDIGWMDVSPTGNRRLDFRVRATHLSGGHFEEVKDLNEYSFANLVKKIGGTIPDGTQDRDAWLRIITAAEQQQAADAKVLEAANAPKTIAGLGGLGKR